MGKAVHCTEKSNERRKQRHNNKTRSSDDKTGTLSIVEDLASLSDAEIKTKWPWKHRDLRFTSYGNYDRSEKQICPVGLTAEFVGEAQEDPNAVRRVLKGQVQLVYLSPEKLINNELYRGMLMSQPYRDRLKAIAVDEAHCVKTWEDEFRVALSLIGDIRCIIPPSVKIMALTATATLETLKVVKTRLSMPDPYIVALSPERSNIRYSVEPDMTVDELSTAISEQLKDHPLH
ncbi:ATP-dependent DNA helicase RecQ-like [Corticium candelabrum]|uniref:ATP-dependent DNA helicase RecQ-like n=1 Tax=Corticium candelabrum TaxID=121492 RepID=UPI002E2733DA|nr:ATP-dependent DNA helicase RecQ-like [Corticium candelabrum]